MYYITSFPVGKLLSKKKTSVGVNVEELEPLCTVGGSVAVGGGVAALENCLTVPQKLDIELPFDPVIPCLDICTKELKTDSNRHLCTSVHSSIIHNYQKVEITQMSINR